ncbi:hypothetical protein B0H14DRAFT_2395176, partial [Mycena olivaceomarginata]
FFTKHGVRWTEFARLKYFDLVRYTAIDPMYNLLLGVAKTQWYGYWVKNGCLRATDINFGRDCNTPGRERELNDIHKFLESFESPLWAGRLPLHVGEPAGGSLTADEYKFAVTGPWAIAVPLVWDRWLKEFDNDYKNASLRYPGALKAYEDKKKAWDRDKKNSSTQPTPKAGLEREKTLLQEYLLKFLEVSMLESFIFAPLTFLQLYGVKEVKPNHHWAVHVPDQVLAYGPVYSFWTFLTERLNKVLKNLDSNNWSGGLLEVSMVR